jgi:hypothetical protein
MDRVRTLFRSVLLHATACIISVPVPCLGLVVMIGILTGILAPVRRTPLRHLSWLQSSNACSSGRDHLHSHGNICILKAREKTKQRSLGGRERVQLYEGKSKRLGLFRSGVKPLRNANQAQPRRQPLFAGQQPRQSQVAPQCLSIRNTAPVFSPLFPKSTV